MRGVPFGGRVGVGLLTILLGAGIACRRSGAPSSATGDGPGTAGASYDADLTDTARVLAGLVPDHRGPLFDLAQTPAWREWQVESAAQWSVARSERLTNVQTWAETELRGVAADCITLLHPFGGADVITSYLLFPGCEGYVLVGSEPAGDLPSLEHASADDLARLTDDVRRGLHDVFPRADAARRVAAPKPGTPGLRGAFPLLAVQLIRLDARIISASRFDLSADGRPLEPTPVRGGSGRAPGLTITFEVGRGKPQSLTYFPAEVDDAALARRPGVWTFLRLQAPFKTVLESAPGLQGDRYTHLRELLLTQSQAVVQDESGIPTQLLKPAEWIVTVSHHAPAAGPAGTTTRVVAVRKTGGAEPDQPQPVR